MNETFDKENTSPASQTHLNNTEYRNCPLMFKDQIETYEQRVQATDISDRLIAWHSYLNYLKQFTQAELKEHKITLQTLYSRCLDKCKGILKERPHDELYSKIFVDYTINYDARPLKMFEWGYKHRVGEIHSFFYIEWAKKHLNEQDYEKAIEVLMSGIAKKATPLNKLKEYLDSVKKSQKSNPVVKQSETAVSVEIECKTTNVQSEDSVLKPVVKKFAFYYDLVHPKDSMEEFSFEEIRAKVHYKAHEQTLKLREKYIEEINELKSKVAELERSQSERPEVKEKISRLNKTRDSIGFKLKSFNQQDYSVFQHGDSPDNLTNVSNFSTWVTNDTKCPMNDSDSDEDDPLVLDKTNDFTRFKIVETEDNLSKMKDEKSSFFMNERSIVNLQPPSKRSNITLSDETSCNITLYNGGVIGNSMMTTYLPTPSVAGSKTLSETRNIIENVFNQTDTIYNEKTSQDTTNSIFIYQDQVYEETMKFPKKAKHASIHLPDQSKDFSIFKDDSKLGDLTAPPVKPIKKYNEDGSLFVYPTSSADTSLENANSNKRKPLRVLSEQEVSEEIEFDPPMMASTCNFKQMKNKLKSEDMDDFEPSAASTCNYKNFRNPGRDAQVMEGKLLETILDETDCDESNLEKEKLFANIKSVLDPEKNSPDSEKTLISKILEEDLLTKRNFKGDTSVSNKTIDSLPSPAVQSVAGSQTGKSVGNFDWDDFDITQKMESDEASLSVIESKAFEFSPLPKDQTALVQRNYPENDDEFLTQENLDRTFNNDCYKLCFNTSAMTITQNFSKFNFKKLVEEQISEFNNEEMNESILNARELVPELGLERTQVTMNTERLHAEKQVADLELTTAQQTTTTKFSLKNNSLEISTFDPDTSSVNTSMFGGPTTMTTTTTNLNNTICKAIQDPFDTDIKNRLLNRSASNLVKKSNYKNLVTQHPMVKEKHTVSLMDGQTYTILEMIGKGAFAKIYLIHNKLNKQKENKKWALKVDTQATAWEFYITEAIHERLNNLVTQKLLHIDVTRSFIKMDQFIKYKNGCFSSMNYYENGSLLDLINYHVSKEECFPYWFVLYLTLEMLNIVDYLHKCKIIHADIKADNFLIDKLPDRIEYFEPNKTKCLVLIDFNRSIDLELLTEEAEFDAKAANRSLLCPEMKSNKTWTYQVDFYGILSCIHCIVFKKYLSVHYGKDHNSVTSSFPRNYDKIYAKMFDEFLNIPDCQNIPDVDQDWIPTFVNLFKMELGTSFYKFSKYLKDLNSTPLRSTAQKIKK